MSELTDQIIRSSQHRFIGRLARDPELRSFDSGNCVCNARILINKPGAKRDDGQDPDGFTLELWGEKAQAFTDATRKGDLVDVTGRVKSETWTDRNTGEQRSVPRILVEDWALAGQPRQAAPAKAAAPAKPVWGSTFNLSEEGPF
jgi:single-strand DNA-binding protein